MKQQTKRLTILLDSEIQELYSPPTLTLEQKRINFLLNDNEMEVFASFRDRHIKAYFIILLGYFKIKPIVLNFNFSDIKDDFYFAVAEYLPSISLGPRNLTPLQKNRIYRHIFLLTGFTPVTPDSRPLLLNRAAIIAKISNEPRYIFDELIDFMATNHVVIPKYSHIQNVISQAVNDEKNRLYQTIQKYSSMELMDFTNSLLTANSTTPLSLIKRKAKDFSLSEIQKEVAACELISPLIKPIDSLIKKLEISKHNVEHYASLVDYYTVTKLRRFHESTSSLYLLCYLQQRFRELNEHLCDAFIYHCRKLTEKAKEYAKETAYKEWKDSASNVTLAGEILALFIDNNYSDKTEFGVVKKKAFSLIKITDIEPLCRYLKNQQLADDDYRWQYYDSQFNDIVDTFRPLFLNLTFSHSEQSPGLLSHLCSFKKYLLEDKDSMPYDRRIIPHKMLPYVVSGDQINQERYEVMLYLLIKDKIEDHLLFVENTLKYTGIRDDLVPDASWEDKDTLIEDSGLDRIQSPPNPLLDDLQTELTNRLSQVSQKINEDDDTDVIMQHRGGKRFWRLPYKGKQKLVNNPFFEKLRSTHIADVLRLVHEETNFLSAFEHISGKRAADALTTQYLIAANIANGTNYGLYKMAQISDCSYDQLKTIQANHLRLETLSDANDMISNAIAKLPIFKHYSLQEGVIHASADGQKFESRMSTFKTRYSSKYFGTEKGVSAITLVANHVPINAQVIGANEHESHYIFDLLYNNTSDIKPDILSTDTHGTNHVNFALLDLFGYSFAPRYAQFSRVIESLFEVKEKNNDVTMSLKKPINHAVIEKDWEIIQHLVISLQQKTTSQSTLVRKLSTYKSSHPYLRAITEYDRLIKSLYILNYIDDKSLRSYVQRALNRGEAYHQLRRAVASVNGNRFRGGADEEIALWNECARLLTNAIIYFNSLILSKLLEYYTQKGDEEMVELIKKVSPVAWVNVNLNGTYSFSFDDDMINIDDLLRPLM